MCGSEAVVCAAPILIWPVNADETRVLNYHEEYKSPGQVASLHDEDAYRSSYHDPVIVGLELGAPYRGYLPLVIGG